MWNDDAYARRIHLLSMNVHYLDFAFDNHLWAMAQNKTVVYKDGFPQIMLQENEIILVTEHDAYGFTVLTNRKELQQEEALRSLLVEVFCE